MKPLKISIPKPCHEEWNKMTQNEKGRFCNSCAKTVVDFTQKSPQEIKNYLLINQGKRVCGHFYKKQLDSITIEIPEQVLHQKLSFTRVFTIALLITMGTTLFSCKTDGKTQKIDNVIVVDSLEKVEKEIDTTLSKVKDSTIEESFVVGRTTLPTDSLHRNLSVTTGTPALNIVEKTDTIVEPPLPPDIEIEGEIIMGDIAPPVDIEEHTVFGYIVVQEKPKFKNSTNSFDDDIKKYVQKEFNFSLSQNLGLTSGKKKIFAHFEIDRSGMIQNIKVRSPHELLEKETIKVLNKLPQVIPAKQGGKIVTVKYTLPISFIVE